MTSQCDIPRTILLLRLLWRCVFCIFAVVVGNVVLLSVPQAREALNVTLTETRLFTWGTLFFLLAVLYWATTAWLVARLLLSRNFQNDSLGAPNGEPFVDWVAAVLPRVLALAATLPITILTLQANLPLGCLVGGTSAVFLLFLVMRTRFGEVTEGHSYGAFGYLGPVSRQAVLGLVAFSFTLLAGLWDVLAGRVMAAVWLASAISLLIWDASRYWFPLECAETKQQKTALEEISQGLNKEARERWGTFAISFVIGALMLAVMVIEPDEIALARMLTSPALLLFALGSWTIFGGFVLSYLPMSKRKPWITLAPWLPLLLFGVGSLYETHWVAQRESPPAADWREKRMSSTQRFEAWIRQVPPGDPVYMVASVGGASRAALWTGSLLTRMDDEARYQGRRFGENLFAISSISGGSLGAAAFVADMAQFADAERGCALLQTPVPAEASECRFRRVTQFLKGDFLAPVVGRMLFPDLFVRFSPFPLPAAVTSEADRSLGLERSWAKDWEQQFGGFPPAVSWRRPLTTMYDQAERADMPPRLPTLLLNTVRLEDGQRLMQSNVKTNLPGVVDLLDPAYDTQRLSLAEAVHNSARFPYVSPGGMILGAVGEGDAGQTKGPKLGRLGDGGYYESSGAATLADLLDEMLKNNLLRRLPGRDRLWACGAGWRMGDQPTCAVKPSPVVAIILDSEPSVYPDNYVRDMDGKPVTMQPGVAVGSMPLPEVLGPVFGGLSTRTNLSILSQRRLSSLVGTEPSAFIELRVPLWRLTDDEGVAGDVCDGHRAQPSMNWKLGACSLQRLERASARDALFGAHPTLAESALTGNLARLRGLIETSASHLATGQPARRP